MSRLFDRMDAGELALGVWIKGAPHLVPSLAKAGFDFVRPDLMFSSVDWKELDHIHRTAQAEGITDWVRIASNPWLAGSQQMQVTVDAARAFSLGIQTVEVSVASVEQVEALLAVANDWHRSGAGEYPSSNEDFVAQEKRAADEALLIPSIESRTAIDDIPKIMDLDGLRAVMISCTDFSKEIGHPFQYDHPAMWEAIDDIVARAKGKGIVVAANTGYDYNTPQTILERVQKLYDHGVRIVMIQGAEFLLERLSGALLNEIQTQISRA